MFLAGFDQLIDLRGWFVIREDLDVGVNDASGGWRQAIPVNHAIFDVRAFAVDELEILKTNPEAILDQLGGELIEGEIMFAGEYPHGVKLPEWEEVREEAGGPDLHSSHRKMAWKHRGCLLEVLGTEETPLLGFLDDLR
jgi:hypothetical protein